MYLQSNSKNFNLTEANKYMIKSS